MQNIRYSILTQFRKLLRYPILENAIYLISQIQGLNEFASKLAPGNNLYKRNSIRNVKRKDINYALDISDYQNWLIYFGITKDNPVGLFELIKKNDIIIDIGTNIGQTAMTFAKLGGENAQILGFEPDPVNYSKATTNLQLNSFKNIQYFNIGIGSKTEELNLKINSVSNRGGNRIDKSNGSDSFPIKVDTLDNIIQSLQIKNVHLIKIDIEGFEFEALKGATETIRKHKPVLYIEIDDDNLKDQGSSAKEVIGFIQTFNYKIEDSITKIIINEHSHVEHSHFDIICS